MNFWHPLSRQDWCRALSPCLCYWCRLLYQSPRGQVMRIGSKAVVFCNFGDAHPAVSSIQLLPSSFWCGFLCFTGSSTLRVRDVATIWRQEGHSWSGSVQLTIADQCIHIAWNATAMLQQCWVRLSQARTYYAASCNLLLLEFAGNSLR